MPNRASGGRPWKASAHEAGQGRNNISCASEEGKETKERRGYRNIEKTAFKVDISSPLHRRRFTSRNSSRYAKALRQAVTLNHCRSTIP